LITYIQGVPIGVLFALIASGFQGEKLISFILGVFVAVLVTLVIPMYRWFYLAPLIHRIFSNTSIKKNLLYESKKKLINFPVIEIYLTFFQFLIGISTAFLVTNSMVELKIFEILPYIFFWLMISGITSISRFFVAEIELSELFINDCMQDIVIKEK
jgi:hypothetical protein